VAELEDTLSNVELNEWVAFYSIEPFGSEIEWLRVGTIAATMVNVARGFSGKKGGATPMSFVPKFATPSGKKSRSRLIRQNLIETFGDRVKLKKDE